MKKYDSVIGLGYNCSTTRYLRTKSLQKYSLPFDWLYGADLTTRLDLILNDFNDFLLLENLSLLDGQAEDDFKRIIDNKTKLCFIHDFIINAKLEDYYNAVYAKYQRRIKRLYDIIYNSEEVALFAIVKEEDISIEILEQYKEKLETKFNKKIDIIVLADRKADKVDKYNKNGVVLVKADILHTDSKKQRLKVMGNEKLINSLIDSYIGIKNMFYLRTLHLSKKYIARLLCLFIFDKKKRKKLKNKYKY